MFSFSLFRTERTPRRIHFAMSRETALPRVACIKFSAHTVLSKAQSGRAR